MPAYVYVMWYVCGCVCVGICMYKGKISIYIYNLFDSNRKTFRNLFLASSYISVTASLYLQVNCATEVSDLSNIDISYL